MSAMLDQSIKPNLQLRPMQAADLDAIMQIEPTIYSHPWTRGANHTGTRRRAAIMMVRQAHHERVILR